MKTKIKKFVRGRTARRPAGQPAVEVTELTDDQWRKAARAGLQRLGLTFDELAQQAATRRFASPEALKFWQVLGGERP
ncbi:hypothetical protein ACPCHT_31945 [Nucisporomicrobium flavum]|uniref:hypothetical protein n=1 Tax=Nucisporomicrobium flavum TaxID=2785915 RepID=UPI003C2E05CA